MGVSDQRHSPAAKQDTHFTGGWVVCGAELDGFEKSRPHWDLIPGPFSP
jgi:hypothetical protein